MINIKYIYQRAEFIDAIRLFFKEKCILEVDTPILNSYCLTHPETIPFKIKIKNNVRYLHTSPESGMKRLLAEINKPIYQICKAFRNDNPDKTHNPEFSILEWYEPGITYFKLMSNIDLLLKNIYNTKSNRISFQESILKFTGIDPFTTSCENLHSFAKKEYKYHKNIDSEYEMNLFFDFLLSKYIIPELSQDKPLYIYNYPYYSSCLARINESNGLKVAERFELYYKGIEIGNGYQELTSSNEFMKRIEKENTLRLDIGEEPLELDKFLYEALKKGMPSSSGVALGLDRMLMLFLGVNDINSILSIDFNNC